MNEEKILKLYDIASKKSTREDEIIKELKENTGKDSILDAIKTIEDEYNSSFVLRNVFNYQIEDRKTLSSQKITNDYFAKMVFENGKYKPEHETEELIVRHIVQSNKYIDSIGIPVFYEFPLIEGRRFSIDLITYDENNNSINLVEVKRCNISRKGPSLLNECEKESKDSFIKVAIQSSVYYHFFMRMMVDEKTRKIILNSFNEVGKALGNAVSVDVNSFPTVNKVILAPSSTYKVNDEEVDNLKNNYHCYVLRLSNDYENLRDCQVGSQKKLFDIL